MRRGGATTTTVFVLYVLRRALFNARADEWEIYPVRFVKSPALLQRCFGIRKSTWVGQLGSLWRSVAQRINLGKVMALSLKREKRTARQYIEDLGNNIALEMVLIPGDSFLMGSPKDEPERDDDESPQHEVTVPAFFMGKYPVTQAQWSAIATLPTSNLDPDPSEFKGSNHPVENVSWLNAAEFCRLLTQKTGRPYRLPSEAEWEYACRAGTTTPFHFGNTITPDLANYSWSSSYNKTQITKEKDFRGTTPVGRFGLANAFGLYDMHGNVWEWCADHWHGNYEVAPINGSAWTDADAEENVFRVLRGGSWYGDPRHCRSATRDTDEAGGRNDGNGFRVVCAAPRALA